MDGGEDQREGVRGGYTKPGDGKMLDKGEDEDRWAGPGSSMEEMNRGS